MIDFVNLKIKPAQSFRGVYMGRVCACMFIGVSTHIYIYMNIYVYTVFKKSGERKSRRCLHSEKSFDRRALDSQVSSLHLPNCTYCLS
jgi:hypothetical protein